jgi:stage II sporulation protein D
MLATVTNQVYGGVEVEHALVNQAVDATAGLVLRYGGLTVDAPYYAACGGRTASPKDAWRDAREEPYLQSVDDID